MPIKRTERGWAGHFICADRCLFRRNTLLEREDTRIIVSTVGLMKGSNGFEQVGFNRYFETMAFHAEYDGRYWDANVSREIGFTSQWSIDEADADDRANDMHEAVVAELTCALVNGEIF